MATNQVFGTEAVADLYEGRKGDTAASYGVDNISRDIAEDLNVWNEYVNMWMADLADPVTVQMQARGYHTNGYMQELDEFGTPLPQKGKPGANVAFPIRRYADALQFTELFLAKATLGQVEDKYNAARKRHLMTLMREMQRAMYTFDSNANFIDRLSAPTVTLAVKGFLNGDGDLIPDSLDFTGSSPEFTASSHDHYLGITGSAVAASDMTNLVNTVEEHDVAGLRIYISRADYAAVSALTGFIAGVDAGLMLPGGLTSQSLATRPVDMLNKNARWVGYWIDSSREVWVHPLALQNYIVAAGINESEKVLGYRQFDVAGLQNLRLAAMQEKFPLRNAFFEHYFGFGVKNREAGAILDITTGSNSYTAPTIAKSPTVE